MLPKSKMVAGHEPVEVNCDEGQYAAADQGDSTEVEQEEVPAVSEAPETDGSRPYSTQIFTMPIPSGSGATVADVAPTQDETVDSLMAQISSQASPRPQMNVPDPASAPSPAPSSSPLASVPDPSLPSMKQTNVASRTSLFDLPDPSAQVNDPFATAQGPEPTSAPVAPPMPVASAHSRSRPFRLPPLRHLSLASAAWAACSVVKRKTNRTA